ncbi:T9SS type A sorting domain-containing protein [uncultured Psychroserpens sp.]|uniref:T9SS type A sorting domain-containing protein n=1 Tax=uncultured Psychroserpens sp. TaxID=255436 RepID=UPI002606FA52|nr:T9SS type A sorting domain-containing protein [uncultured Psychroserpens sp.]
MYKKLLLFAAFGLSCFLSTNAYGYAGDQLSTNDLCECETVLDPSFELTNFDTDNCTASFVASPGDNVCVEDFYLLYYWSRNGGAESVTSNPEYTFTDISDLGNVELRVVASVSQLGQYLCEKTYEVAYTDYTCSVAAEGDIIVRKAAYPRNSDVETCNVYTTTPFDWRITIENTYENKSFTFRWEDQFLTTPDGDGDGIGDCDFTFTSMSIQYPGTMPSDIPVVFDGIFILEPGTTIINYIVAPSDGSCTTVGSIPDPAVCQNIESCNCDAPYINRFGYEYFERETLTSAIDELGPIFGSGESCSEVCLRYGCPAALKDGFCLEEHQIESGDILESEIAFHASFGNIVKMEGDIIYDSEKVEDLSVELSNFIPNSFSVSILPTGTNSATMIVETNEYGDAFDIGSGGTHTPFKLKGTLINDLSDCFSFQLVNFKMTSYNGIGLQVSSVFVDPGEFCEYYDDNYDEAWITTTNGESCASSDNVLTLTALGPFETQDPSVQYEWSTGEDTQEISVSTGGTYSVLITDENGCPREASITLETCPTVCECGDLAPQIQLEVVGCQVYATALVNDCDSFTNVNYHWEFSNGNEYDGINPPPQSNWPNGGWLSAKLQVSYVVPGDFGFCIEPTVKNEIFIPCRSNKGRLASDFKMYPNPAKDQLTIFIDTQDDQKGSLEIMNSVGSVVIKSSHDSNINKKTNLDVSKLNPGIYFVRYTSQDDNTIIKKLVIN